MPPILKIFFVSFILTILSNFLISFYVRKMNENEINLTIETGVLPFGLNVLVLLKIILWAITIITGILAMIVVFTK